MPLHVPELAPILARIESIVYEQERRIDGGELIGEFDECAYELTRMTEEQLHDAQHEAEETACDLIDGTGMDKHERKRARVYVHTALMDFADAVNNENRVVNPRDKARAVCEVARVSERTRAIITYPRALELIDALDMAEGAAERHRNAHDPDEHMTTLTEAVDKMRTVRRFGPAGAEQYRTAFVMLLGDYLNVRGAHVDYHRDTLLRVAAELDDARNELADAYVKELDAVKVAVTIGPDPVLPHPRQGRGVGR